MIKKDIQLQNVLGLHARAASFFVKVSSQFSSTIIIEKDGQQADGKSILSLMTMAADYRSWINITVDGEDEDKAMESILHLIEDRFGEEE